MDFLTKPLTTRTFGGCLAVWFSLISVMGVLHAMEHTGLYGLFGWFGFAVGTLAVFYTHTGKFKIENSALPIGGLGLRIAIFVAFFAHIVMITDMAGAW